MRLDIRYVTRFVYPQQVWDSQNVLRACPVPTERQRLLSYRLRLDPEASVSSYVDAWGTRVDTFGIREPHEELTVIAEAEVETSPPPRPSLTPPLESLTEAGFRESHWRFLQPTRHTRWGSELREAAEDLAGGASDVVDLVTRVQRGVHDALEYRPGATSVGVDVNQVWLDATGVCQDFVHVALAMYRILGVPVRYVSGYFYATDPSVGSAPNDGRITVQTHAWLEVAIPGHGWWGLDPTNALEESERHVKIGHGRDYDDVLPMRGVYYGNADHALEVAVTMAVDGLPELQLPVIEARASEDVQSQ